MITTRPTLAVTGSTGFVGGHAARALAGDGIPVRLIVRDPTRAPSLERAVVETATYGDYEAARLALDGAQTLLMVSAAESEQRRLEHTTFVDAARDAGVRHIVYTSFMGASEDCTFTLGRDHWATEQHIRASGMAFTFLRDNFYSDFTRHMVGEDGVIRGPGGDGVASWVARADVADAAAAVLRDPAAHAGATYDLTGPEALSFAQVASVLSRELGTSITYMPESIPEAYESRAPWNAPAWQVDAWVSTYTSIAAGELSAVSGDVERITDHAPRPLAEAVRG